MARSFTLNQIDALSEVLDDYASAMCRHVTEEHRAERPDAIVHLREIIQILDGWQE